MMFFVTKKNLVKLKILLKAWNFLKCSLVIVDNHRILTINYIYFISPFINVKNKKA